MNEPSEGSNNSNQINSQNNYKYDQYGFVLVNTIEDLLYDRFNNNMENDYNDINNKKDKKYNGNCNNLMRNCKSIDINKKARKYNDKSMRLVLKINNKDRKAFKIYPNDSRSIESITLKEKESDIKNNYTKESSRKKKDLKKYRKKDKNKKNSKKKTKRIFDNNNNENNDEFTFCEEENEDDSYNNNNNKTKRKKIIMKKKIRKKETESPLEDEEEEEEDDEEEEESDTEIKRKKKLGILSRPILSQCIMTKTRMSESENSLVIPKANMNFITKTYDNTGKKKKAKILTWPNSTLCYFYKNNKIIHMNIQIPLQNVVNKNYFCTKQITDTNDKLLLPKTPVSPNVVIKIINPENSPYKYGKINIKARSGKNSSPIQKTYLFKIRGNKPKKECCKDKDKLSKSNCFKNVEIIKALNKKKKSKSNKKKEIISPECIALKRRRKFGDKIYKKMMQKVYPAEYKISIRTKFRNTVLNNKRLLESKKEEEKLLVKNNSMNAYNNIKANKNIKNIKYPSIRRMILDENNKNKIPSFIKDPKFNFSFQTLGRYNSNNISQNFPAINSYFH